MTNSFKRISLGIIALFSVSFLSSCWSDYGSEYCKAYVVCDTRITVRGYYDGVYEYPLSEFCVPQHHPYRDYQYEMCSYGDKYFYSESCHIEERCEFYEPECVSDSDCTHRRKCVNNQCQHYDIASGHGEASGAERYIGKACDDNSTCREGDATNNLCIYYDKNEAFGSCAFACLSTADCETGYVCEYSKNDIDSGYCLNQKFPCNADSDCGDDGMKQQRRGLQIRTCTR